MIINHQHRFCFFAVPRTGSTAISTLLLNEFDSEQRLPRHLSYLEFTDTATRDEKQYFTFAAVRNPLDSVVSAYYKKKTDHNGRFSRGTFKKGRPIGKRAMDEYRYIIQGNSFADYFLEFYQEPYRIPRHEATLERVDQVLHYESLQKGFSKVLNTLKLPDKIIPLTNTTSGRATDFKTYYPPRIHQRAREVFGDFMNRWGYTFPEDWK